ncbi:MULTISPECIES: hypothetical protein [unclassified Rhizobium]|uniref:hypothetical protein n=1 Tax=unclassified Rhizobium TaxID=2613769 RepID=UPI001846652B|nr:MULTISPECIES: hypothetical protein [unclassified Rhizobium]MBB3288754.1 hypothetical protein [Rhizobium sp. BK252]MBB3403496.1 hypothetical protein [Rhizobium sp. BK289]MBB3416319.1 hypothetical protein [Rhizobium sp. BK284]MBB3483959.1 hypothetical protein [Rhizobium sp. BK347]
MLKEQKRNVDPSKVIINSAGQVFREIFIRLPKEAIADDLKEPDLWQAVQRGPKALKKFDRLVIVAWDESWVAEAIVSHADGNIAVVAKPRITQFPERVEKLFSDGTYAIRWNGAGYDVVRLRDGAVVSGGHHNAALAERALANMYPRRA